MGLGPSWTGLRGLMGIGSSEAPDRRKMGQFPKERQPPLYKTCTSHVHALYPLGLGQRPVLSDMLSCLVDGFGTTSRHV